MKNKQKDPITASEMGRRGGSVKGKKGFAVMTTAMKRKIAAMGGSATAKEGKGFAGLSPAKLRKVSASGGRAKAIKREEQ